MRCLRVLATACLLSCAGWAEAAVRSISNESEAKKPVQLTADIFDTEISGVPASHSLLVEFYAHWYD